MAAMAAHRAHRVQGDWLSASREQFSWLLLLERLDAPRSKASRASREKTNSLQTAALGASRIQAQLVKIFTEATQLQTNQACEGKSSEVHMFFCIPSACRLHAICQAALQMASMQSLFPLPWT